MNDLNNFQNHLIEFAKNIDTFECSLNSIKSKQENIKLLVWQTKNKLSNFLNEIAQDLENVKNLEENIL
tara:strand:+ start:21559 stop:21765 length:207 start_codon:yes stop_codon:yes gene_type:complete